MYLGMYVFGVSLELFVHLTTCYPNLILSVYKYEVCLAVVY